MSKTSSYTIFKQGSTTFFTASLFFPKQIRKDVFSLYAFVRVFDDFVDNIPQQSEEYFNLKNEYLEKLTSGDSSKTVNQHSNFELSLVVDDFIELQRKCHFEQSWVDSFFESMEMDLQKTDYLTIQETEKYMYGSAEVIGLMMSKILKLSPESFEYAQKLGKAFQFMNMIRDVAEDVSFGRKYLPTEDLTTFGLQSLSEQDAVELPEQFKKFINFQISRYRKWREEAEQGFKYIPRQYLIPIKAAVEMFDYTIDEVQKDPLQIWKKKIKPTKLRAILTTLKQFI